MTGPIIQVPYLRPDPVHEEQGPDQLGGLVRLLAAHQQQQQMLLQKRGELALEQEKFDAENKQRTESNKMRQQAIDALNGMLSGGAIPPKSSPQQKGATGGGPQQPQGQGAPQDQAGRQGGLGTIAGGGAGFPQIAEQLARQQGQQATRTAVGQAMAEFQQGDVRNPAAQARLLMNLSAIDPESARTASEALRSLQGDYEMHMGNDGRLYVLDKKSGSWHAGPDTGPKGTKGVAPEKLRTAAVTALQGLMGMEGVVRDNPDADRDPALAAMFREGKVLGVSAEPAVNALQDPNKLMFRRNLRLFADGYMGMFGTSAARSPTIFKAIIGAYAPQGGESDPKIRANAAAIRDNTKRLVGQVAQGQTIDMSQMPFFGDFMREQSQQAAGTPSPGTAPNPADYLNGPPQ